jgi:predicted hotdog family 3-hydroxylacyl-ACP dehydratase
MLASGKTILDLIPQKPPMVMVDKLFECDELKAVTGLTVSADNILVKHGYFTESGLIENMAQSSALMTGWLAMNKRGCEQKIKAGVIGGIKDFQLYFLPEVSSEIITEINVLHLIANATIVNGKVMVNDTISAECELKIFSSEENEKI